MTPIGRKTLDQLAQSVDFNVRRQATWGMSVKKSKENMDSPAIFKPFLDKSLEEITAYGREGNVDAQLFLGGLYFNEETKFNGRTILRDLELSEYWLKEASLNGNPAAQYDLGILYELNNEFDESFFWYKKSVESKYPKAFFNLALLYAKGKGTNKNIEKAMELSTYAAEHDIADAQSFLCSIYLQSQDLELAAYWGTRAAEQEHPMALYNLGIMHKDGLGVRQDLLKSISLFEKASSLGISGADLMLGIIYDTNQHLSTNNKEKAYEYYVKAANKGVAQAQLNLGISLYKGEGVEKNNVNALMWLMIASSNNYPQASKMKDFIKNKMSNSDIMVAQNLARKHILGQNKS